MADLTSQTANRGADASVVFSQQNVSITAQPRGTSATAPFDIVFRFGQPFTYNPASGQLVIDFFWREPATGPGPIVDAQDYGFDNNAPVSRISENYPFTPVQRYGFVTEFSYQPVPEPSVKVLFVLGSAILSVWARRSR
jgi:hypothetical protein